MTDLSHLPPPSPKRRNPNSWDGEDIFAVVAAALVWLALLAVLIVGFLVPSTAWPWTWLLTL